MSINAIENEFNSAVEVLEWDTPNDNGVVGLVAKPDGTFCVVELDENDEIPFFEDFSTDEADEAKAHFDELCQSVAARRKSRALTQTAFRDLFGAPHPEEMMA